MWTKFANKFFLVVMAILWISSQAAAETLKPFVLGDTPTGDLKQVADAVKLKVTAAGFEIVGSYFAFCQRHRDLRHQQRLENDRGQRAQRWIRRCSAHRGDRRQGQDPGGVCEPSLSRHGLRHGQARVCFQQAQDCSGRRKDIRFGKRYS